MKSNNILNYFKESNESFIHPKGEIGSDYLLIQLKLKKNDVILELGFGTGASLVKAITLNNQIELYGAEKSSLMLEKAQERLYFCNIGDKVTLKLLSENQTIPFESDFFDKIYVESVLAIQEKEELILMMSELARVLKPKGLLCVNELLWSSNTKQGAIDIVNEFAKDKFGIIQANGNYKYIGDWLNLFKELDFEIIKSQNIDTILKEKKSFFGSKSEILSRIFSFKGKVKKKIFSKLRKEWDFYENEMSILKQDYKLEPYMIIAVKK